MSFLTGFNLHNVKRVTITRTEGPISHTRWIDFKFTDENGRELEITVFGDPEIVHAIDVPLNEPELEPEPELVEDETV